MNRISEVQEYLKQEHKDAWIMVDYENKNPTLVSFLGNKMLTRKIFLIIPSTGKPYLITHSIDTVFLNVEEITSIFDLKVYHTWKEMLALEKELFASYKEVIMDISEYGLLPRVSLADYGSVEFIKELGIKVSSSGDILERFSALYDKKAYEGQVYACKKALEIKDEAFDLIRKDILEKGESDEYRIQKFICDRFHEEGMVYDDPAIVAVNTNASNPHYGPTVDIHSPIHEGDVVLIDMWAKLDREDGVYADITWMGYVGSEVPAHVEERFQILRKAVDDSFHFIKENLPFRRVEGYEVDDVSREVVTKAGYGQYFTHRTGHNIAVDVSPHGPGVNIDNYESHDTRAIIPGVTFSLEPGIYAPDFGMRCETDVYIDENKNPIMVGGRQEHVIAILKKSN
jgi:Xaa-Pro aminopeptidase